MFQVLYFDRNRSFYSGLIEALHRSAFKHSVDETSQKDSLYDMIRNKTYDVCVMVTDSEDDSIVVSCVSNLGVPVVTVSSDASMDTLMCASGSSFHLVSTDIDMSFLERSIRYTALQAKARKTMYEQATFDSLTKTYRRGPFMELLNHAVARSCDNGTPLSFCMVDLNDLKILNDTFGHLAGDAVLSSFGEFLNCHVRATDMVCRYGGDEFAILLPNTDFEAAQSCLDRIFSNLGHLELYFEGVPVTATASFGASTLLPGMTAADLIDEADKALYRHKRGTTCPRISPKQTSALSTQGS